MFHSSCRVVSCHASCHASCFISMCLSCLIVDVKSVTALQGTSVDTIGMRSQNHAGRHGLRKHESRFMCHEAFVACFMSCFLACSMLYVIYFTFHAFVLCSMSCLVSSFMLLGMFNVYSVFHALCFMLRISCSIYSMPEVMLLRVVFYGMHVVSCHVSFMSYRVKALTSAEILECAYRKQASGQTRSMEA